MTEVSFTGKTIEDTYDKRSMHESIILKPEIYLSNMTTTKENTTIYKDGAIITVNQNTNDGYKKIFDEVISNAADQYVRIADSEFPVKNIKVDFNDDGSISVYNDGAGLDVVIHKKTGKYVPEMVFANLLTSGNYTIGEKRVTTGQFGLGAKLTNIFSLKFTVETVDPIRKLLYLQTYENNMYTINPPEISKYTKKPYTKITYLTDYARFGLVPGSEELMQIRGELIRRVYDFSIYTGKGCNMFINNEKIKCKSFEDYINLYIGSNKKEVKRVYYEIPSWEICVTLSPEEEPMQVSFINGCFTDLGGKHIDYILNLLCKRLIEMSKLKKDAVPIKPEHIKKYIWLFVKGTIPNPTFDTQTKRRLTTLYSNFDSKIELSDDFIKKIGDLGILEKAQKLTNFKSASLLSKKTNGKKTKKVYDPKLLDCEYAGTNKSDKAVLIFTEGDSAAGFFKEGRSGLTEEEKRCYACFPLKGKILNTQKATSLKISNNAEITKIKKLIGLVDGKKYTPENISKELRYGKVMFLADADTDGDHIKGLCMSFIYTGWPELIELGYICSFPTPVIKVWKKLSNEDEEPDQNKVIPFYSEAEYLSWKKDHPESGYIHKYYKGLATHSQVETRHCFKNKVITNYYYGDTAIEKKQSRESIEMLFKPKREEDRKAWMLGIDAHPKPELAYNVPTETLTKFIDHRAYKHCKADNLRSIPSIYDGLKPSQRKAIYCFIFGKNKGKTIKVGSLSGMMMQDIAYHHGEMSANETIINLGQNYIGAGNLNLFRPVGIFGTRSLNGKDHGAARYISVGNLSYLSVLFNKTDLEVLPKNYDDGILIEPEYFVPILPIVLLTGCDGIGTGWSTTILPYSVHDVCANVISCIRGEPMKEMIPFYRGYLGSIIKIAENKYISIGKYEIISENEIKITELPIGSKLSKSFSKYKEFLYTLAGFSYNEKGKKKTDADDDDNESITGLPEGTIQDINISNEMANEIQINVIFRDGYLEEQLSTNNNYEFEKKFKLALMFSTTNMHLYRKSGIHLYSSPLEIINEFYGERIHLYHIRKDFLIKETEDKLAIARNRYRFVSEIIEEKISIFKKTKIQINTILAAENYLCIDHGYEYLLSMQIYSFSKEKLDELRKLCAGLEIKITELRDRDVKDMWIDEIDEFMELYLRENEIWQKNINLSTSSKPAKKPALKLKK